MNAETLDATCYELRWYEGATAPTGDDPEGWVEVRYYEPPDYVEDMMEEGFNHDTKEDGYGRYS